MGGPALGRDWIGQRARSFHSGGSLFANSAAGCAARLAVQPQQVVPGQAESADGWLRADTAIRSMPVVAVASSSV
jgi:hypothetical protein